MTVFFELNHRIDDFLSIMAFLQYYYKNNIKIVSLNHSVDNENNLIKVFEGCKVPKPNLYVDKPSNISFATMISDSVFKGDLYVMCDINHLYNYRNIINNNFCNVYYFSDKPLVKTNDLTYSSEQKTIKAIRNLTVIPSNASSNFTIANKTIFDSLNKLINNISQLSFLKEYVSQESYNHLACFIYSFFSDCFDIENKKIIFTENGYVIKESGDEVHLCTDIHKSDPAIAFVFEQFFQKNRRAVEADRINIPSRYNILIYKNTSLDSINIEECGWERRLPNQSFSTITKDWYSLHVISKGYGRIVHDGIVEQFGKGDMFILKPNHAYQYISDENDPCEYFWICMSGNALKYYLDNVMVLENYKTHVNKNVANANKIIDAIKSIVNSHENEKSFILYSKSQLYKILTLIVENGEVSTETNVVNSIKQYINDNFSRGISVNDVCNYFTYDRTYLFRLFKSSTGKSIGEYISSCKREALINYLQNTNISLDKICIKTGFNNKTSLISFCKSEFGLTPTEYRKQHNLNK